METLRGAWDTALAFLTPYYNQTLAFLRTLDSVVWWTVGGVLLVLFLLWLLLRRREPRKDGRPEVLLSLGTIAAPDGGVAGTEGRHLLRLTVSNLNTYAVQVLELALKTPEMDAPVTAEVAAVVPPEGSVLLEQPVTGVTGDEGRLNVYFYTAGKRRIYRLQAPFALEPWNNRYKVSPLDQSVTSVRQLASAGVSRAQEQTWRDRQGRREQETPSHAPREAVYVVREKPRQRREAGERPAEKPRRSSEPVEAPHYSDNHSETVFPDEF